VKGPVAGLLAPTFWAVGFAACCLLAGNEAAAAEFEIVHAGLWGDLIPIEAFRDGKEDLTPKCNVEMRGEIVDGDLARLKHAYTKAQKGRKATPSYLCLDSPGGSLSEALAIIDWLMKGQGIGIATVVDAGAACLSSCALVFLSGSRIDHNVGGYAPQVERWLHVHGRLGFHAPYLDESVLPDRGVTREEAMNFYKAAQTATNKIIAVFQHRQTFDSAIPGRSEWARASLFSELMLKGPSEFINIDTIDSAGRWDIPLFGVEPLRYDAVNDEMARTSCRNQIAWDEDRFAGDDQHYFAGDILARNTKRGENPSKEFEVLVANRHDERCKLSISSDRAGVVSAVNVVLTREGKDVSSGGGTSLWWSLLPPATMLSSLASTKSAATAAAAATAARRAWEERDAKLNPLRPPATNDTKSYQRWCEKFKFDDAILNARDYDRIRQDCRKHGNYLLMDRNLALTFSGKNELDLTHSNPRHIIPDGPNGPVPDMCASAGGPIDVRRCQSATISISRRDEADGTVITIHREINSVTTKYPLAGKTDEGAEKVATTSPRVVTQIGGEITQVGGFILRTNSDVFGGDLRTLQGVDIGQCQVSCRGEPSCISFSFDKWNNWCFLKGSLGVLRVDPKYDSGIREGAGDPPKSSAPLKMVRYRGKAFPYGGQSTSAAATLEECESRCAASNSCVAVTYFRTLRQCRTMKETRGEYFSDPKADTSVKRQAVR